MVGIRDLKMKPLSREDISEELMDEDLFLYDENSGSVHQLNSGAAMVWLLCDGTRKITAIAGEIASASDKSMDEVVQDVRTTVGRFQTLGLLESR